MDTVDALRKAGAEVLGIVSIFSYGMKKGIERMKEKGIKNISLSVLDDLVEVAAKEGYIKEEEIEKLIRFRDDPSDEGWMKGE